MPLPTRITRERRFDQTAGKLLSFFAASGTLDPFLGRRLPSLATAVGLAETGSEARACHRQGGSGEAEVIDEFRANGDQVGGYFAGMSLLLLTTRGARSGQPHTTPLSYFADGDRCIVFACWSDRVG